MAVKGSPSFSGVRDVRGALARADMGGVLNTRELLSVAGVLTSARAVRSYGMSAEKQSCIDSLFRSLQANKFLEDKIVASIPAEDEIADAASSDLADIRRKMRAAAARVRDSLQKIISAPSMAKFLQDPIITTRSDRFVVPVKAEHKNSVPGLVHDVSASGATLFVEPMAAVKANNEIRELKAREKAEIERILAELSADCAAHRSDIDSDYSLLVHLDVIFARAKLSLKLDCAEPELSEEGIRLRRARHPLLDRGKAVPIDVSLGEDFDTLVITGPNTGGKTVTLKTIGLLCLMAQCGLHIPASDGSRVRIFDSVLADIGDEQSIEQSLSTSGERAQKRRPDRRHHPLLRAEDLRHQHGGRDERVLRVRRGYAQADLPPAHRHTRKVQRLCHLPAAGPRRGDHRGRPLPRGRHRRAVRGDHREARADAQDHGS